MRAARPAASQLALRTLATAAGIAWVLALLAPPAAGDHTSSPSDPFSGLSVPTALCFGLSMMSLYISIVLFAVVTKKSGIRKSWPLLPLVLTGPILLILGIQALMGSGDEVPAGPGLTAGACGLLATGALAGINALRRKQAATSEAYATRKGEVTGQLQALLAVRNEIHGKIVKLHERSVDLERRGASPRFIAGCRGQLQVASEVLNRVILPDADTAARGPPLAPPSIYDPAHTFLQNAEQALLDGEAFLAGRATATVQFAAATARIQQLEQDRSAASVEAARRLDEARRRFAGADDVAGLQASIALLAGSLTVIQEGEAALRSREDQRADALRRLADAAGQVTSYESHRNRDADLLLRAKAGIEATQASLDEEARSPSMAILSRARDTLRQAEEVLQMLQSREETRIAVTQGLDDLRHQVAELPGWSSEDPAGIVQAIAAANAELHANRPDEARSGLDAARERFQALEERSLPSLEATPDAAAFALNRWQDYVVSLANNGTAAAEEVHVELEVPDARIRASEHAPSYRVKAGETLRIPTPLVFTAEGDVPLTVRVSWRDRHGNNGSTEVESRVQVGKAGSQAATAGGTEAAAVAAGTGGEEERPLKPMLTPTFRQGFYVLKVAVRNQSRLVAQDVNVRLVFDKTIFRLHHTYPDSYALAGETVEYGNVNPDTTRSVEFYLEAHMCTETIIDGVITYRDVMGRTRAYNLERHHATFVCPILGHGALPAPGQLRDLLAQEDWKKDTKTFAVPGVLPLRTVFALTKEVVERHHLRLVFEERLPGGGTEAWYYGQTEPQPPAAEGVQHAVIVRVKDVDGAGILEIDQASPHQYQRFSLGARLRSDLDSALREKAQLSQPIQQIFSTADAARIAADAMAKAQVATAQITAQAQLETRRMEEGRLLERDRADTEFRRKDQELREVAAMDLIGTGRAGEVYGTRSGGAAPPGTRPAPGPERQFAYETYRKLVRQVYHDGMLTTDERLLLVAQRKLLELSADEGAQLEDEVLKDQEPAKR